MSESAESSLDQKRGSINGQLLLTNGSSSPVSSNNGDTMKNGNGNGNCDDEESHKNGNGTK